MISIPYTCPRGRDDCISLSKIEADGLESFFCCGENNGKAPSVEEDKYTVCFKGPHRDQTSYHDKRDIIHQAAVLAQALAVVQAGYDDAADWSAQDTYRKPILTAP